MKKRPEPLAGVTAGYALPSRLEGTWVREPGAAGYRFAMVFGFSRESMRVVQVVGIELSAASSETAPVTAAVLAAFPLRAIVDRYKPDALTLVEELVGLMHRPDESLADALRRAASPEPRQPRRHVRPEQLERLRELLTEADATGNSHRRTAYARHVLSEEMGYEIPKRTIDNWRQKIERGAK